MPIATELKLRDLRAEDWPEVARIFGEGIATGNATFEAEVPSWRAWDAAHLASPRLVAELSGRVVGWAALTPTSSRPCYAGVLDSSVYVSSAARRHGVGRALLERLVMEAERAGIWTIQAGVFPENEPSIQLHLACGFRVVGTRERIGKLSGTWRDVTVLERRSELVS